MEMERVEEKDKHTITHVNVHCNCGKRTTLLSSGRLDYVLKKQNLSRGVKDRSQQVKQSKERVV